MKTFLILLLLSSSAFADEWRTEDTYREVAYLTLHAIDWGQTRTIAKNPDRFSEVNAFLGSHPSVAAVDEYFLATAVGHVVVSTLLTAKYREVFQNGTIALEVYCIGNNFSLGINVSF